MRFVRLRDAKLVRTSFRHPDLLSAQFTDSCLVEADFEGASLYEANFSGALLSGANFLGADVSHADFRGATELTCEQLESAGNWQSAFRDGDSRVGHQFRPTRSAPWVSNFGKCTG